MQNDMHILICFSINAVLTFLLEFVNYIMKLFQ